MPLIRLLAQADQGRRDEIVAIMRGDVQRRLELLLPMLEQSDARDYTLERAQFFVNRGVDSLADLPDSGARESLKKLAQFAIRRTF